MRLTGRIARGAPRPVAVGPGAMLLATLVGAWLGHALEYLRVWGTRGFGGLVARSLHAYMGPVGLVLLLAGFVATASTSLVAGELERRLAWLRRGLRAGARTGGNGSSGATGSNGGTGRNGGTGCGVAVARTPAIVSFSTLAALLWVSQLPLYLIQENVEASVAHVPPPGFGALSGRHVLAPLVHLLVAAGVAGVLYLTRRRVTRLAGEVRRAVALLAALRRSSPAVAAPRPIARSWTPGERWGKQSWSRPPPVLACAL